MLKRKLNATEIVMAQALLQFVTYYPDYPPLKALGNIGFEGRKDFLMLVDDGISLQADIQQCSPEQLNFFAQKVSEIPELIGEWDELENGWTRIWISPADAD
jgi:hypothetical protein